MDDFTFKTIINSHWLAEPVCHWLADVISWFNNMRTSDTNCKEVNDTTDTETRVFSLPDQKCRERYPNTRHCTEAHESQLLGTITVGLRLRLKQTTGPWAGRWQHRHHRSFHVLAPILILKLFLNTYPKNSGLPIVHDWFLLLDRELMFEYYIQL